MQYVRQDLFSRRLEREAGVRPRALEQRVNRIRDRPRVAAPMQVCQESQGAGDRLEPLGNRTARQPERVQTTIPVPVLEDLLIADREERPVKRRENRELIVGPLERGERGAHRLHFAARVEGSAADQEMADAARVQLSDVGTCDLLGEATEQNADVPRLDGN